MSVLTALLVDTLRKLLVSIGIDLVKLLGQYAAQAVSAQLTAFASRNPEMDFDTVRSSWNEAKKVVLDAARQVEDEARGWAGYTKDEVSYLKHAIVEANGAANLEARGIVIDKAQLTGMIADAAQVVNVEQSEAGSSDVPILPGNQP